MGICKRQKSREVYYDEGAFTRTILSVLPLTFTAVILPNAISSVNSYIINVVPISCLLEINPVTKVMTVKNLIFTIHNMIAVNTTLAGVVFQDFAPVPSLAVSDIPLAKLTTGFDFPINIQNNAACEIVDIVPQPSFTIVPPNTLNEDLTINFTVLIVADEHSMVPLCRMSATTIN